MNYIKTFIVIFFIVLTGTYCNAQTVDSLSELKAISNRYYNELAAPGSSEISLRYEVKGFKNFDHDLSNELMINVFAEKIESETYLFFIAKKDLKSGVYKVCLWTPVYMDDEDDYSSGEVSIKNDQVILSEHVGINYTSASSTTIAYRKSDFRVVRYEQTNENTSGGNQYGTIVDFEKGIASQKVWIREGVDDFDSTITILYKPLYATPIKEEPAPVRVYEKEFIVENAPQWQGENDLSFTVSSHWDENNIYLTVDVKDDTLIFFDEKKKGADHVTCLMNLSDCQYSQLLNKTCKDSTLLEFKFNLVNNNQNNLALVNYSDTVDRVLTYMVTYTCQYSRNGYTMKVVLPKALLKQLATNKKTTFLDGTKINFTILVSDSDDTKNIAKQVVMATSQTNMFDISSLGAFIIMNKHNTDLPRFADWKIMKNIYVNAIR